LSTFKTSRFLAAHAQNKGESSMTKFVVAAKKFATEEEGATLVEYALLVALLALASAVILTSIGQNIRIFFIRVNDRVVTATPAP
jgi:Flp pilus assembly pilin Flp